MSAEIATWLKMHVMQPRKMQKTWHVNSILSAHRSNICKGRSVKMVVVQDDCLMCALLCLPIAVVLYK